MSSWERTGEQLVPGRRRASATKGETAVPVAEPRLAEHRGDRAAVVERLTVDLAHLGTAQPAVTDKTGQGERPLVVDDRARKRDQVVAARIVTADGSFLDLSAAKDPELFNAFRTSIGMFGLIVSLTLQAVPSYNIHKSSWNKDKED